ncbi:hypothetical protein KJ641_04355 [Patescibacteria group bacterium]|nr:hypothetical protein [Patescibacteria group bacterium]MBU1896068.1 hypothetical protein [Patescibacteria group bacterium]
MSIPKKNKKVEKSEEDNLTTEKTKESTTSSEVDVSKNSNDSLKELIEKNIKWSQVIYNQNKEIKHRLTLMTVATWVRILLFVIPIVLAIIFLPPLLDSVLGQYGDLLNSGGGGLDINSILDSLTPDQVEQGMKLLNR